VGAQPLSRQRVFRPVKIERHQDHPTVVGERWPDDLTQ
jgi:hypothetical protein